jgi:hypothetical protein
MGWGDAWAGLSQQSFGLAIDTLRGRQQQKFQAERDEIALKAAEAQEKSRRAYEEKKANSQIMQTYTDPMTGEIIPVTQGQVRSGQARVPQSVLQAQRAEAEMANQIAMEDRELKGRRTEAQITADQARAQSSLAQAERARRPSPLSQTRADPNVSAVRSAYNTIANKGNKTQEQIMAELESLYGPDVVDQAFPGQGARREQAAQSVGRVVTGVDDLLDKYLKR